MSEEEQKEPDYRAIIRRRAQQTSGLRQQAFEKAEPKRTLQQKIELSKEKKKTAQG